MIKKILLGIPWVIAKIYVTIFRGTPMIVQAMVIYYGSSTVFGIDLKPFNAAIFIILLNTGAYMSETVRGGINSIDVGQIEGAKALGMGYVPMNDLYYPFHRLLKSSHRRSKIPFVAK